MFEASNKILAVDPHSTTLQYCTQTDNATLAQGLSTKSAYGRSKQASLKFRFPIVVFIISVPQAVNLEKFNEEMQGGKKWIEHLR